MVQQASKNRKPQKTVKVIARYFIKATGAIVYKVQSSKGNETYCTTIINGRATGCTCPALKPCYHMTQLEQREQERTENAAVAGEQLAEQKLADFRKHSQIDAYEQLAATKKPAAVYSLKCPHLVPVGHEHEECGACLDKLYG